jgi:twitching motility protein PilT
MRIASRRLGEFLIERRVLSRDVLEELLAREERDGVHLSQLLVTDRLVSEQDLVAAVASELGVRFVDLNDQSILGDVWGLITEDFARGYMAVAVERRGDGVVVVMEDPADEAVLAALAEDLGVPVIPAVAVRDEIARLLDQMYGEARDADGWESDDAADAERPPAKAPSPSKQLVLGDLLTRVLRLGGSDLHLTVGTTPAARVEGQLMPIEGYPKLNGSDVRRLIFGILTHKQRERFLAERELETSHAIPGKGRFRVSLFVQRDSMGAVFRVVPSRITPFADLGLPERLLSLADLGRGLVLVNGPHGSGISTTLASFVDHINSTRSCHIMTIEDPIEYLHQHRRAIVNQREVGEDTDSIAVALRHALRQDPDVLVIGELPNAETIELALAAAETGHLVFTTLPTLDAVTSVDRVIDVFPITQRPQVRLQLAMVLQAIIVQQLVPTTTGGRVLATEVMTAGPGVRAALRGGEVGALANALITGVSEGMQTMDRALAALANEGRITTQVALDRCNDPEELKHFLTETDEGLR